jgi:LPXTG-motif cell wall-anchored protein
MTRAVSRVVLAAFAIVCLAAGVASAQQSTTSTEAKSFEVIAVDGNRLVVKLPEGTRELTVPEDFRFTVNGQPLSARELKPGMSGTATITTTTTVTPVTVTEVKNGTVIQKSGGSILVQTEEGYKNFTQGALDKRGVTIMRYGKSATIDELHTGDKLTATIVTSMPPNVMTEKEVQLSTGGSKGAATAPAAASAPAPAPASKSETLPKTASPLPLLGLMGVASLVAGMGLTALRRRR